MQSPTAPPRPFSPRRSGHRVVLVAYDQLRLLEFGTVAELFGQKRPEFDFTWYRFAVCAAEQRPLTAIGGITIAVDGGLTLLDEADTIVIPGWRDVRERPPAALSENLLRAYRGGTRMVSICTGAFVLAAAGILDGRPATTHWLYTTELARRHPKVSVQANRLFVDDGQVLTAAGAGAGIDLGLHIIRKDFGSDTAFRVAQRLVAAPPRPGDQPQYTPVPEAETDDSALSKVMVWLTQDLQRSPTILEIAQQANVSERTLHRRFTELTGKGPLAWLMDQRLRSARQLLRHTDRPIDDIAAACGFVSIETFRQQFRKRVGVSPTSYRDTFDGR